MIETLASPAGWGSPFILGLFMISLGIFMVCLGAFIRLVAPLDKKRSN